MQVRGGFVRTDSHHGVNRLGNTVAHMLHTHVSAQAVTSFLILLLLILATAYHLCPEFLRPSVCCASLRQQQPAGQRLHASPCQQTGGRVHAACAGACLLSRPQRVWQHCICLVGQLLQLQPSWAESWDGTLLKDRHKEQMAWFDRRIAPSFVCLRVLVHVGPPLGVLTPGSRPAWRAAESEQLGGPEQPSVPPLLTLLASHCQLAQELCRTAPVPVWSFPMHVHSAPLSIACCQACFAGTLCAC